MIWRSPAIVVVALSTVFSFNCASGAQASGSQATGSESRSWTGTLFDSGRTNCSAEVKNASAPGTCPVTVCTSQFGIRLPDGKLYKFDDGSNPKAADALRQSKRGSGIAYNYWKTGKTAKPVTARVTGTLTSDTLNLETIKVD